MSFSIRKATLSDLPEVLEHLEEFDKFYNSKTSLYKNKENATRFTSDFIENHLFLVAEEDENKKVIGFITGLICPHIYNPEIMTLVEAFWWIDPSKRNLGVGTELFNSFKKFGEDNVDWVICNIEDDSPIKDEFFLKRGFKLKEKSFLLEVN